MTLANGLDYHVIMGKPMLAIEGKIKLLEAARYAVTYENLPGYQVRVTIAHWHSDGKPDSIYRCRMELDEIPLKDRTQAWKTHPMQMLRAKTVSHLFDEILKDDPDLLSLTEQALTEQALTEQALTEQALTEQALAGTSLDGSRLPAAQVKKT